MSKPKFIPLKPYVKYSEKIMLERATSFYDSIRSRRTIREFSSRSVPRDVIAKCIQAAGTAPSGANHQPWHFVAVSDPSIKKRFRVAAEKEEREFYNNRASQEWKDALVHLGTDEHKPFLEDAPWLIVVFAQSFELKDDGTKVKNYYVQESVGLATGFLINALHHVGLATLTHTPSPMGFANEILNRPKNERAFLILVTGYPADDVKVPDLTKKPLDEIATFSGPL